MSKQRKSFRYGTVIKPNHPNSFVLLGGPETDPVVQSGEAQLYAVECHRRIQALKALGENMDVYGRVLKPKFLRAFPADICRAWLIQAKRERIPECSIKKLTEYHNEEVDGALSAQKIRSKYLRLLPTFLQPPTST